MTAGGLPTVTILLDDGTGTFPYDISAYGRMTEGITGARGRQDELSQVTAPQPVLVLDNADGRFSFGSTLIASPSPILVDQKVRVWLTANGTTVNRYTGTLIAGNVSFPGGGDEFAIVTVTLADVQAQAERRPLRSVIEEEILSDLPSGYYTLSEPAGTTSAHDLSGNQAPNLIPYGTGSAVAFGAVSPISAFDAGTWATFAGGRYLGYPQGLASPYGSGTPAFVFAFATTSAATMGLLGDGQDFQVSTSGGVVTVCAQTFSPPNAVNDGLGHVIALRFTDSTHCDVYVDGTKVNVSPVGMAGGFAPNGLLFLGNDFVGGHSVFTGTMGHLAVFTSTPSAARLIQESNAMLTGFAGESGTAAITRIAGWAGIPIGALDTSLTNIPFVDVTGKTAMAAIQEVADAEFGLVFFDGSGNLTFHNRNRAVGKTAPDITIDANQLDPGTAFYYDALGILNYVTVTAAGTQVAQVAWNKVSELGAAGSPKHGRYPDSKTYRVSSDAEAIDRGNWLVSTHGQPAPRVPSLVIDLLTMTPAQQAAWLAVEPDTWLRITGLPAQTNGGTTADLIVEGWAEVLNAATWTLALNTASKTAFFQAFILDDATLGVLDTSRIYV